MGTLSKWLIRIISLALGRAELPKAVQRHKGEQPGPALQLSAGFCVYWPSCRSWQRWIHQTPLSVAANSSGAVPVRAGAAQPSWNGWEGFAGITRQKVQRWKVALQNSGSCSKGALLSCNESKAQRHHFHGKKWEHRDAPCPGHIFLPHSPMFLQ